MEKPEIRRELLLKRGEMTRLEIDYHSKQIMQKLEQLPEFQEAEAVLFYYPHLAEVSLLELMSKVLLKKKVYLPRLVSEVQFEAHRCMTLDELVKNQYGIPEPKPESPMAKELDLIIVPGVGFDLAGTRLGMGKGYYDRFLADQKAGIRVGVAYESQILDSLPKESYDENVDLILTEERAIRCS